MTGSDSSDDPDDLKRNREKYYMRSFERKTGYYSVDLMLGLQAWSPPKDMVMSFSNDWEQQQLLGS